MAKSPSILAALVGAGIISVAPGGGVVPVTPTLVARNAVVMTGPGHSAAALLTGDGTEKTYTIDFQNVSGAPMTMASLVTLGWQVQADGGGAQKLNVGNDITITSATIEYPIGGGSPASMDVGTTVNGGIRSGAGVALTTAIPHGATARLVLKATPPNTQKYSVNFGLAGIRTHALNTTLSPSGLGTSDSIATNDGSYCINAATDNYPWVHFGVIGNKLQRAAAMASEYAELASALNATYFCLFGTNDVGSRTLAQMQGDVGTLNTAMSALGVPVYCHTLPPNVTSTNGTYAPGDQTVSAAETNRTAYNDWIRTLPSGIKVFELADALETARNSGFWKYGSANSYHLTDNENVTVSAVTSQTQVACAGMVTPAAVGASAVLLSTSGANAGTTRVINSISGTTLFLASAFTNTVAIGDTFTIKPVTNKSTTDGLHFTAPYPNGLQFGGFYIARDAIRTLMNSILAAAAKAPHAKWGTIDLTGTNGATAPISVNYPPNIQVDDRAFIVVASSNQPIPAPTGWTERASIGSGTAATAGAVRCQVFEKDTAYAAGDASPTLDGTGTNHILFKMFSVRGAKKVGSCVAQVASAIDSTASLTGSFPAVTTTQDGCLILNVLADETDIATARLSGESNPNLLFLTERLDIGNVTGNGSGVGLYSGMLPAAGSSGQTAFTHTQTTDKALITLAIKRDL